MEMIKCFVGPMYSGKTTAMINMYNKIWNKDNVMCFKPKTDDRDYGLIKSRDFKDGIKAICIDKLEEIYQYMEDNTKTLFIDEAEFLKGDVRVLVDLSINREIDIYIAGLNMTAEQKPFGLMPYIMAVSDNIEIIPGVCYICNKPAYYTYYEGEKTTDILVGNTNYLPLCASCLYKKRNKGKELKLTK